MQHDQILIVRNFIYGWTQWLSRSTVTTVEKQCNGWTEKALELSRPVSGMLGLLPQPLVGGRSQEEVVGSMKGKVSEGPCRKPQNSVLCI